ncbi:hypothetical protein PoB_003542300 [Plakobranchus ocellatus]|uniref:Uncharacterized protein n=1 Tax=Plakobranchus ocellatus TaxID=259542 RepID=A0AAV4ANK1_9GAST|nr:hypothetical protein PoB_003542300 [Plakobranchus ocellatus]
MVKKEVDKRMRHKRKLGQKTKQVGKQCRPCTAERQYMGDNPLSSTYCREAVHGRQPTVTHILQRGSTWATTHCRPRTAERQYMGDNPLSPTYCSTWATTHCRPRTTERQYMGNNVPPPMYW